MPGPVPLRDGERHGHHTPAGGKAQQVDIADLFADESIADESHRIPPTDPSPWVTDLDEDERNEREYVGELMDHPRAPKIPLHVTPPPVNPDWEPVAKEIYLSSQESGQCTFYEPSDWAALYLACESLSRDLAPQFVGIAEATGEVIRERIPLKGASLNAYLKLFSQLMVTEGERRRLRLELNRNAVADEAEAGKVIDISSVREGLV